MTAQELKAIRQRFKLSQADLAAFLQAAKSTISRWESGERPIPGPARCLLTLLVESSGQLFHSAPWMK